MKDNLGQECVKGASILQGNIGTIASKFRRGEVQIWESVGKCQNYRLFDIFWDILNKMKDNLGQECVKGASILQGNIGTIASNFPENDSFPALILLFCLSLPKIWLPHPHKNYIFEMSNNRAIR